MDEEAENTCDKCGLEEVGCFESWRLFIISISEVHDQLHPNITQNLAAVKI